MKMFGIGYGDCLTAPITTIILIKNDERIKNWAPCTGKK